MLKLNNQQQKTYHLKFSHPNRHNKKSITNWAKNVNKRNRDSTANKDELVEEYGKYFEETLNSSSDLIDKVKHSRSITRLENKFIKLHKRKTQNSNKIYENKK